MMRLAPALAVAAILFGCTVPAPMYVRAKGFPETSLVGRTIHLFPVQGFKVDPGADFREIPVSGNDRGLNIGEIGIGRLIAARAAIRLMPAKLVHDSLFQPAPGLRDSLFAMPGDEAAVRIRFPSERTLRDSGISPDLGLFIGSIFLDRDEANAKPDFRPKIESGMLLRMEGEYLLWDYRTGRAAAYGRFREEAERPAKHSHGETGPLGWQRLVDKAVIKIALGSGWATMGSGAGQYRRP